MYSLIYFPVFPGISNPVFQTNYQIQIYEKLILSNSIFYIFFAQFNFIYSRNKHFCEICFFFILAIKFCQDWTSKIRDISKNDCFSPGFELQYMKSSIDVWSVFNRRGKGYKGGSIVDDDHSKLKGHSKNLNTVYVSKISLESNLDPQSLSFRKIKRHVFLEMSS